MILFNLTLRVFLIPGTIVFLRKVQNPTYFWVPIVWDLDCVNRMRFGRFTVDSTEARTRAPSTQGTAGAPAVDFFDGRYTVYCINEI